MLAIALVTDMIFGTKIKGTADQLGLPLSVVRTAQALADGAGGADLAIIDLNADGLDAVDAIRRCKAPGLPSPTVIAYASHVQKDLIQAAQDAGADLVLPRSRFSAELPELLTRFAGPRRGSARG
ncbi:MAG: response regulator transcription factor [Planctomycetes bacterium]|nr:response regulator transcription factor [Planctomycetota bacterium]